MSDTGKPEIGPLERTLREKRAAGRKLFVPYLTGGLGDWTGAVEAAVSAGGDAVEIGIPFSDPIMDGPTIQEASMRALEAGTTPERIVSELAALDTDAPLAVMTYYNLIYRKGHRRMAASLVEAGVAGAIVPDVPLDEIGDWAAAADWAGLETVLLAAPTTPEERLPEICARSRGFVYGVGLMGVTGERAALAASATTMAKRLRAVTDKPVLIGIGISTPEQAVEACAEADGVVVGSAVVRRMLEGHGPDGVADLVAAFRKALDRG